MNETGYLVIAILIIVILTFTFIVTFVLYNKTSPKGLDDKDERLGDEDCSACAFKDCKYHPKHAEEVENND